VLTLTVQGVGPHTALPAGRPVDFFGPTALVAISSTSQSIYATAHRYLGTDGSPADSLKLYMCYQRVRSGPSGPVLDEVQAVGLGMAGGRVPADTRVPFGLSAVITGRTAGTYNIGMCGQTLSPNWTSNDLRLPLDPPRQRLAAAPAGRARRARLAGSPERRAHPSPRTVIIRRRRTQCRSTLGRHAAHVRSFATMG
jgi:hypothetical protein